jgi:hypothetical protein
MTHTLATVGDFDLRALHEALDARQRELRPCECHTRKLYEALDAERGVRGLTEKQVASEIGVASTHARGLARGGRAALPAVIRLTSWLGQPAAMFVRTPPH